MAVSFCVKIGEFMNKYKPQIIVCPQCKRIVGKYDGRSTINPTVKCKFCNKLIFYDIKSGECELKPIPKRE